MFWLEMPVMAVSLSVATDHSLHIYWLSDFTNLTGISTHNLFFKS